MCRSAHRQRRRHHGRTLGPLAASAAQTRALALNAQVATSATARLRQRHPGHPLGETTRLGGAESFGSSGPGARRLDFAITGRSVGHERLEEIARRGGYLLYGTVESGLICLGGPGKAAQLPDKLQGRRVDLLLRGGRLEVVQRLDVTTHDNPLQLKMTTRAAKSQTPTPSLTLPRSRVYRPGT